MTNTTPQPTCVLPGCPNAVREQGRPCDACVADFGDYLRMGDGSGITAEQQATRDRETMRMYALQQEWSSGDTEADQSQPAATPPEPERKANQRCWMCEERHTCTKAEHGWECDTCRSIE